MLFAQRIWNWCRRFRHRCGYGVHSPSDFFLITSVMYEKLPYYAYDRLKMSSSTKALPHYREKVNKLLFRLVNYFRPTTLIEVGNGNGDAIRYMKEACSPMTSVSLRGQDKEETLRLLKGALMRQGKIDFLHIAFTPYYKEVFEEACPYLHAESCVIIGNIYASPEKEMWWKRLTADDERVRISFDLYDIGLLRFEEKRFKQNYIVNFF